MSRSTLLILAVLLTPRWAAARAATPDAPADSSAPAPAPTSEAAPGKPTPSAAPVVVPPALVKGANITYPDVAPERRIEVSVVLQLTVGADGNVSDVSVVTGHGEPFDQMALEAASQLVFTPATRDGVPIAARIQFRSVFTPPAPVSAATETTVPVAAVPTPVESTPTPAAASNEPPEVEVTVAGEMNRLDKLQQSADSVTVLRLEEAKKSSSDMGEVLARTPGVIVRRAGGLGADARISLGGLYDDAIQLFVDGVPLWMSGFPDNVSLIPVNIISHVEIYNGVVPLRLSADALGGAINFVTDRSYENRVSASFQTGSFGMYRSTAMVQGRNDDTGFVARASGFFDSAKNNYEIDVEVPDERGRLSDAKVERLHDRYRAFAYFAEVGYVERPWAERLILKGFYGQSYKEYQHNLVMTVPYGEVNYGDRTAGAQLLYEHSLSDTVDVQAVALVSHKLYHFSDESEWVYNWFGEQVNPRRVAGELESKPSNQTLWVDSGFGRLLGSWKPSLQHAFQLTTTPIFVTQTGDERRQADPDARDPLTALAQMTRVVSGAGYEWHAVPYEEVDTPRSSEDFAWENRFSIKHYYYTTRAEQPLAGNIFRRRDISRTRWGVTDGVRYGLTRALFLKGAYEFATRLPTPYEVFGDGGLVLPNVELQPETSHNINLGVLLDAKQTASGDWMAQVFAGYRNTRDQIYAIGNDKFITYQNIYNTVNMNIFGTVDWKSRSGLLQLNTGGEYLDPRNRSTTGVFANSNGDRTPNRPYLELSWGSRLNFKDLRAAGDSLELFYQGRHTGGFFRGWESQGQREYKQKVDPQTNNDIGAIYTWSTTFGRFSGSAECQNVLDARLFDNYGQQRPGRAFYVKAMADL